MDGKKVFGFILLFLAVVLFFVGSYVQISQGLKQILPFINTFLVVIGGVLLFQKGETKKTEEVDEVLFKKLEKYEKGIFDEFLIDKENESVFLKKMGNLIGFTGAQLDTLSHQAKILSEIKNFINNSVDSIIKYSETTDKISLKLLEFTKVASENVNLLYNALNDLKIAASEIAQSIATTAQKTASTRELAIKTKDVIETLSQSSAQIGKVAEFIGEIADQTNLLALNASIEAARAGEAGKGFAVVANEVKELARQTASATDEIRQIIRSIQEETKKAVEAVETITNSVLEIDDLANTIASASEEQSVTISDITNNIEEVKRVVDETEKEAHVLMEHVKEFKSLRTSLEASQSSIDTISLQNNVALAGIKVSEEFLKKAVECADVHVKLKTFLLTRYTILNEVVDGLIQNRPVEIDYDDPFVKFLVEEIRRSVSIPQEFKEEHKNFHEALQKVLKALREGMWEKAVYEFRAKLVPSFYKLSALFNKILAEHEVAIHEIGVEEEEVFMEWSDDLETGITEIDNQHRRLVSMVNEFYRAFKKGVDRSYIGKLLQELIEYTDYHFKTEEYYFDKFGYPEAEVHKQIHRKLVEQVLEFKKKFDEGKADISYELLNFLKDWLLNHIGKTDKKYADFLKSKGLK